MGAPWTSSPVTDSTPREASKGNGEMYQTLAGLAKNELHPPFPWPTATETLQAAGGHPGRAHSGGYVGPPRSGSSKSTVFQAPSPGALPSFWLLPASFTCVLLPPQCPGTDPQPGIRAGLSAEPPCSTAGRVEDGADSPGRRGVASQIPVWAGGGKRPTFTATRPATSSKRPASGGSDLAV